MSIRSQILSEYQSKKHKHTTIHILSTIITLSKSREIDRDLRIDVREKSPELVERGGRREANRWRRRGTASKPFRYRRRWKILQHEGSLAPANYSWHFPANSRVSWWSDYRGCMGFLAWGLGLLVLLLRLIFCEFILERWWEVKRWPFLKVQYGRVHVFPVLRVLQGMKRRRFICDD